MKFYAAILTVFLYSLPMLAQEQIDYRFDEVKRKVTLTSSKGDSRVSAGVLAKSGDRVQTGWFAYALLAAPRYAAHFEIFAGSDVQLASNTPGVLLSLERGRLKAIFDKLTGDEPRMVRTPGALLAVRGTRYGIEVGSDGAATLVVFEGTVEVRSELTPQPQLVHTGEICHFSRSMRPDVMPMPPGMNEEMWNRHGRDTDGTMPGPGGMDGSPGGMNGSPGGMNGPPGGTSGSPGGMKMPSGNGHH